MKTKLKPHDADFIERALKVLSPVWTATILLQLSRGKRRPKHLLKAMPGLSTKVLIDRVRMLEKCGLITRVSFREVPPRVEYSLTTEGEEVVKLLNSVKEVSAILDEEERDNWGQKARQIV